MKTTWSPRPCRSLPRRSRRRIFSWPASTLPSIHREWETSNLTVCLNDIRGFPCVSETSSRRKVEIEKTGRTVSQSHVVQFYNLVELGINNWYMQQVIHSFETRASKTDTFLRSTERRWNGSKLIKLWHIFVAFEVIIINGTHWTSATFNSSARRPVHIHKSLDVAS